MEQKLLELDKTLESLVLPKLPNGREIVAIRQYIGIYSIHQNTLTIQITDKLEWEGVKKARVKDVETCDHWVEESIYAGIILGVMDWNIHTLRHNLPTIIAATQLIDIVVERVLGCSCGYEMNSLVK